MWATGEKIPGSNQVKQKTGGTQSPVNSKVHDILFEGLSGRTTLNQYSLEQCPSKNGNVLRVHWLQYDNKEFSRGFHNLKNTLSLVKISVLKALLLCIGDRTWAVYKKERKKNSSYETWVLLEWMTAFPWVWPSGLGKK